MAGAMSMSVPKIENRYVCVAGARKELLAAQLSSYFYESGKYFAVFEFPETGHPFEEPAPKDGYFAQIIGRRAAIHINNCLAHIQPESIILLGLSSSDESYLRPNLPPEKLVSVSSKSELLSLPFVCDKTVEPLLCKPSQFVAGLVAARSQSRPLAYSDAAPDLPEFCQRGGEGLILVENRVEVGEVTIINYANSLGADIILVDPVERDEVLYLPSQLREWAANHASPALKDIRQKITRRIKGVDFSEYNFATFFTAGLPYGLILENVIPFTHILNGPFVGVLIANAITNENGMPPIGSALLFSLREFDDDETDDVAKRLSEKQFVVTALVEGGATNANLSAFGGHLPYDILHICSHGGETDGYFVKQPFIDRDGRQHLLEYFEVVSFAPSPLDSEKVRVERKIIFTTLDGVAWSDEPLGRCPRYVGDDMMQAIRDDDDGLKRTPTKFPIALSCHIKCHQSFHQGAFDSLAGNTHPIVFNNSCSSSHELAASFLSAGARCYIATLWNVGSKTAKDAALAFYNSSLASTKLLSGFTAMLNSIKNPQYRNVYILWGFHFTSFVAPTEKSDANVIAGLICNYEMWMHKLTTSADPEVRENIRPILHFIATELSQRLPPERLKAVTVAPSPEKEVERSGSAGELIRNEITITFER